MSTFDETGAKSKREYPRSLPLSEWPVADQQAWNDAFRPGSRLIRGGAGSYLAQVSRQDFAQRYGAFLGFLQRADQLRHDMPPAAQVTSTNLEAYISELDTRVRSVTVWNNIYKLRRAAELLSPTTDFSWLAEIEKDLALVKQPRSKFDRLVLTDRLVEAGLTLMAEAQSFARSDFARAKGMRNGLMIALLAFCPIRLKNFAALEVGSTFKEVHGRWWITLPSVTTKSRRPDERCVPELLNRDIVVYLQQCRPVLIRSKSNTAALWISARTGAQLTKKNLSTLISKVTLAAVGVDVSPHLFRTAAATTAAAYGGDTPYLASALLNHTDPRVTEESYTRPSSVTASKAYAEIINGFLRD
jgi:site-specific recombinase XerD